MGRKPARPDRLTQDDVRTTLITILAVARQWSSEIENRAFGLATHEAYDFDRAFLAKLVTLARHHEEVRPLTYSKTTKPVPTTKKHLQALRLRREVAAVIKAARTGDLPSDVAVGRIVGLVGDQHVRHVRQWAEATMTFNREGKRNTPTKDAEELLQRLDVGAASSGRITQTIEAERRARRAELETQRSRSVLLPYVFSLFDIRKELHDPLTKAALSLASETDREQEEKAVQGNLNLEGRAKGVMGRIGKFFKGV